jgi:hypothetical protein
MVADASHWNKKHDIDSLWDIGRATRTYKFWPFIPDKKILGIKDRVKTWSGWSCSNPNICKTRTKYKYLLLVW